MRKNLFLSLLFAATMLSAQSPVELPLWPDGAPNTNGLTGEQEDLKGGRVANVTHPSITVYRPAKPNGMAVIMCPGGGYARLAMNHEGHDMAAWFTTQGITYAVLKYRMPNGHNEVPVGCRASHPPGTQTCRGMGCQPQPYRYHGSIRRRTSGSFLATLYGSDATRPDFQILFYPVISMLKGVTHSGSRQNLIGETPSAELEQKYSLERQVSPKTPQAFIMLSADDATVLPINGIGYFLALREQKVPATLRLSTGGHGWGFRDSFTYKRQWTGELEKWLREGLTFPEK